MPFPGLSANFNEPQSDDTTSAPPMPDQQPTQQPTVGQSLAAALSKRKKSGLIGPTVKQPSELKAAIARARRARPSSEKYG
jgi:hypothetical protein